MLNPAKWRILGARAEAWLVAVVGPVGAAEDRGHGDGAATLARVVGCEAVEAFEFDARWKYACGGLAFDHCGFVHTVLVDMRARLADSDRPRRIFEVSLDAARRAGIVSVKRVLDSTQLYDAVATQDTVTMIRSAIRRLLAVADAISRSSCRRC